MSEPVVDPTSGEVYELDPDSPGCPRCDAERKRADAIQGDLEGETRENRNLRRKLTRLEKQLAEQREQAPERPTAITLFRKWVEATGRNPKTTKLGEKREVALLKAIRMYDADFVERAIVGGAAFANTSPAQAEREALIATMHKAMSMLSEKAQAELRAYYRDQLGQATKYDDLELICRDEVKLERFHRLAGRLPDYSE